MVTSKAWWGGGGGVGELPPTISLSLFFSFFVFFFSLMWHFLNDLVVLTQKYVHKILGEGGRTTLKGNWGWFGHPKG
jgi:hypothetical protein